MDSQAQYRRAELIMVASGANHNKFYNMQEQSDGTFLVSFGRVGSSSQTTSYPMRCWDTKYREKIRKGYQDVTDLREVKEVKVQPKTDWKPISNQSVASLVKELLSKARGLVRKNYLVEASAVTTAMVQKAQRVLSNLVHTKSVLEFNKQLETLFTIIPRRMSSVSDYMASNPSEFGEIISREQELLDVMAGQVNNDPIVVKGDGDPKKTILQANGLKIKPATKAQLAEIKRLLGSSADRLVEAWSVTNQTTQERFDKFLEETPIKTIKLWHGSRTENWWSILKTGLLLKPTNAVITGKMFGNGIYFAPSAKKSMGYTSLHDSYWVEGEDDHGYMAVMEVAYGTPLDIYRYESRDGHLNATYLKRLKPDANCVHAHAGRSLKNDEIVVYDEAQVTIKYLVKLK